MGEPKNGGSAFPRLLSLVLTGRMNSSARRAKPFPGRFVGWLSSWGATPTPLLLACVPGRLKFFRVAWLEYCRPNYKGRLLNTGDVGYLYGTPPGPRAGAEVIPGRFLERSPEKRDRRHPCPRRLSHVRWLVGRWSDLEDTVCDPFAGSGNTGVACQLEGRRYIGIEIEDKYVQIAAERLRQGVLI